MEDNKSFASIISKENWGKLSDVSNDKQISDWESFLRKHNIHILSDDGNNYTINPKIAREIVEEFRFYLLLNDESNSFINAINYVIEETPDKTEREKFINHKTNEYLERYSRLEIIPILNENGIEEDPDNVHFLNIMTSSILRDNSILKEYLTVGVDMSFLDYDLFKKWFEFAPVYKVLQHLKNPLPKKRFSSLLSKKRYESMSFREQDQFEIDNQIFISLPPRFYKGEFWPEPNTFNPALAEEIFEHYTTFEHIHHIEYAGYKIDALRFKLDSALNKNQKQKILEKEYAKYIKKREKIELFESLYWADKGLNTSSDRFINLIKNAIIEDEFIYVEWITEGERIHYFDYKLDSEPKTYLDYSLFQEWYYLDYYSLIIKFLRDYQENLITSDHPTPPTQNLPSKLLEVELNHSNHHIYKYESVSEKLFYYILRGIGVIDTNNKVTDKKIKPVLSAIFEYENSRNRNCYLFKGHISQTEFAKWSVNLLNIQINKQYKLPDGNYYINAVKSEYESYLSNSNLPNPTSNNK